MTWISQFRDGLILVILVEASDLSSFPLDPQNGLVAPRAGSEGPAGTHGANGGVVVGGGAGVGVGAVPVVGSGAIGTENATSTGSLKKKSVSAQSVNGE